MALTKTQEECKKFEIIVLSFMTKDKSFINRFMSYGPINSIRKFFSNEDCKYIFELVKDYKIKFNEVLIKEIFEELIDNATISKEIDTVKRVRLLDLFDEIIEEQKNWKPEHFPQLVHEWFQVEIAPEFSELLRKEKTKLDEFKTFQVFTEIKKMINRYESLVKVDEGLEVLFLNEYLPELKREFNEARLKGSSDDGVMSGIKSLDNHLVNGFGKGKLSLIGGRASSGKTTLAVNIATNMMREGKKVIYVSLEMDKKELTNYMVARIAKIPYARLAKPDQNSEKYSELINIVYDKIRHEFCILKGNAGAYTWEEIESIIENEIYSQGFDADCIIVDYLALIALPRDGQRRDIQLGDLAKKMRTFAEKTHTAIITLVQANRQSITKDPKTGKDMVDIKLENIEDSNKVGQDADMFLTINQSVQGDNSVKYDVWIKKQRGGKREVLVELDSDMRYYWIMDQEGMYNEPFALGENPTKEERELYVEVTKIDKKDSAKIDTGIDEDDTSVSEDDFDEKITVSSKIEKIIDEEGTEKSDLTHSNGIESASTNTHDFLSMFDDKINSSNDKIKDEKIINCKVPEQSFRIDMFEPNIDEGFESGYSSYE